MISRRYAGILSPQQQTLLDTLMQAAPQVVVSYDVLRRAVGGKGKAPVIKVLVCRIRRALDLDIPCVRSVGYLLSVEDRGKLRIDSAATAALKAKNAARAA